MKCDGCKFADWRRTVSGRLHPDKTGQCTRLVQRPLDVRLPAAFYWIGRVALSGGFISRGGELKSGCDFKMAGDAP